MPRPILNLTMNLRGLFFILRRYLLTAALFLVIGLLFVDKGLLAFSPGEVSEKSESNQVLGGFKSHAEFETECQLCHQPLMASQAVLCMDCHKEIQVQLIEQDGLHASFSQGQPCFDCHPDHRGRDFDPRLPALLSFDHRFTAFSLAHHQVSYQNAPLDCASCHQDKNFDADNSSCRECHTANDPIYMDSHIRLAGEDCLACHDGVDRMRAFAHKETGYDLRGAHSEAACAACHLPGTFLEVPTDCAGCHAEPELHRAYFSPPCQNCHSEEGWTPANLDGQSFSHANDTRFSLARHPHDYDGRPLACQSCHKVDVNTFDQVLCIDCHTAEDQGFMAEHQAQFGQECLACHDGVDRMHDFDHNQVFPLDGRHAEIECEDCHGDYQFVGTPGSCISCHEEPELHLGLFGQKCQYCHSAVAWTPAFLSIHPFPLNHGSDVDSECTLCHLASYQEYTCYECHEHQEEAIVESHTRAGILPEEIYQCVSCHPTGLEG